MIAGDMRITGVGVEDAEDRAKWRFKI